MRWSRLGCLVLLRIWLTQFAVGQAITEFPAGGAPRNIVSGPDGSLWFTELGPGLGRITTSGVVTHVPINTPGGPYDLVFDRSGDLWFTETGRIGRLSPDGKLVEYTVGPFGAVGSPGGITLGPDSNIWFTFSVPGPGIGRITPSGSISTFPLASAPTPFGITAGPDGNVWFTETNNRVGRISPSGTVTEFPAPSGGFSGGITGAITAGPDGALWFTVSPDRIGRITTSGKVTAFTIPDSVGVQSLGGITSGPDGNLWFTEGSYPQTPGPHGPYTNRVGRITMDGAISGVSLPTELPYPVGITTGADGNLWVAEYYGGRIARVSSSAIACATDTSTLCLDSSRFRVSTTWYPISPPLTNSGSAASLTNNTGAFWFFSPDNLELVVKVLDGRSINGRFWVFYGSLTNVAFRMTVTDTETGAVKTYFNPRGQLASVADTAAF